MASAFLPVAESEEEEAMELPLEADGSLLLSTAAAQYAGCCGLRYRAAPGGPYRGVRLVAGALRPPEEGWGQRTYLCAFPRRRPDPAPERAARRPRCSDLIVLGLPWKSTEENVREYFERFGDLQMVQIKRDSKTGLSKGFGFIKFADYDGQLRALGQRHMIDGRWCDVRIPNSKEGPAPRVPSKVFVGRCTENMTADDLRDYFEAFGQVTDIFIPKPFRAFSFVTFLDPEVAQSLCGQDHIIKGVSVNISTASPKQDRSDQHNGRPSAGPGAFQQWVGGRGGVAPPAPVGQALIAAGWGLLDGGGAPPPRALYNWAAESWPQPEPQPKGYIKYD